MNVWTRHSIEVIVLITINVPVVYRARYVMALRRARSITRGIGRGGPWKSRLFWAPKWLRAKGVPFGAKKNQPPARHASAHFYSLYPLYSLVLCSLPSGIVPAFRILLRRPGRQSATGAAITTAELKRGPICDRKTPRGGGGGKNMKTLKRARRGD